MTRIPDAPERPDATRHTSLCPQQAAVSREARLRDAAPRSRAKHSGARRTLGRGSAAPQACSALLKVVVPDGKLHVTGLVERSLMLSRTEIEQRFWMAALHAGAPGESGVGVVWTGIPLAVLLRAAGLRPAARRVRCVGRGGASSVFCIADILAASSEEKVQCADASRCAAPFVAYAADDEPLREEHGGPLRLVVPGRTSSIEGAGLCAVKALE